MTRATIRVRNPLALALAGGAVLLLVAFPDLALWLPRVLQG